MMIHFDNALFTSELQIVGEDINDNSVWALLKIFINGLHYEYSYKEYKSKQSPPYFEFHGKGVACPLNAYVFKLERDITVKFLNAERTLAFIQLHFREKFLSNFISIVVSQEPLDEENTYKPCESHLIV